MKEEDCGALLLDWTEDPPWEELSTGRLLGGATNEEDPPSALLAPVVEEDACALLGCAEEDDAGASDVAEDVAEDVPARLEDNPLLACMEDVTAADEELPTTPASDAPGPASLDGAELEHALSNRKTAVAARRRWVMERARVGEVGGACMVGWTGPAFDAVLRRPGSVP